MRVLVTGGTGFIGRAVVEHLLELGDAVTGFTRRVEEAQKAFAGAERVEWVSWDPATDGSWQSRISGHDAVAHLAGESAVGRRYTPELERAILESRVGSTERLVEGMDRATARPRVFVCASGVGYYGNYDDDRPLDENAPAGNDFLARVCVEWERSARGAEALGVRTVSARTGFVLGRGGGALGKLVPIFKAFVGGPLGNGRQISSWIHMDDVVGAYVHAMRDESLRGPINVTAPNAVSNAELSKLLGKVLGRPALFPAPAFALRALFGDGAEPLLGGQRAVPKALLDHGYRFRFTDLEMALRDLLRDEHAK